MHLIFIYLDLLLCKCKYSLENNLTNNTLEDLFFLLAKILKSRLHKKGRIYLLKLFFVNLSFQLKLMSKVFTICLLIHCKALVLQKLWLCYDIHSPNVVFLQTF